MLRGLTITNMLLIDHLDLEFQSGLNVLTGETGAGKSILLDSLGFVLGWRGRADLVRAGADQGEVSAWFDLSPNHPAHTVLEEAGLSSDGELVMRRVNVSDGRKTAYVNDRRCSGEVLRRLSETLVELHGQHDDRGLLDPKVHRNLLDAFASLDTTDLRKSWRAVSTAQNALETAQAELLEAEKDGEFLRHSVGEIDELSPEAGEDTTLDAQRRLMQSAERIRDDIVKAGQAITGGENLLTDATRWLNDVADKAEGRLETPINALSRALSELSDAERGVADCLDTLTFNSFELEAVEERLFAIRALARKHNTQPDDLPQFAEILRARLNALDTGADHLKALQITLEQAKSDYEKLAKAAHEQRVAAASSLDQAMLAELAPLKMERAVFETRITTIEAGPEGSDEVIFTVATNPGAPAGAINKIASGGELSRFLLALKVCLTADATGLTMIFDEIDRGVGGATADAVGRRLLSLAKGGQVLVVTHSPQVAALGGHHWQVSKSVENDITTTDVSKLDKKQRIVELARMLSGDVITKEAKAAAEKLLQG